MRCNVRLAKCTVGRVYMHSGVARIVLYLLKLFNIICGSVFLWKFLEVVYVMDSRLDVPHRKPGCGEQENSFPAPARNQTPFMQSTEQSWLYM